MTNRNVWPEALQARLTELMRVAIAEAKRADQPFGCALADFETGKLLGSAPNSDSSDPTGHAEVNALRLMASLKLDPHNVVLISTAEPCPMCAAASWWAAVRGVVFGTPIATLMRFGWGQIDLSCTQLLAHAKPRSQLILQGGFLASETDDLYCQGPKIRKKD